MDVTASAITIVSSVWTLTVHCKSLIEGIRNSDEKFNDLERKAKSFANVIGQVDNAYPSNWIGQDDFSISEDERRIRSDIGNELSRCKEDLKTFDEEVLRLLKQRKSGKYVKLLVNSWREKVAKPTFERIDRSIGDHHSCLQSLLEVHHGRKLDETRNDLKQFMTAVTRLFDKIEDQTQVQGANGQMRHQGNGSSPLERRDSEVSDITLVNQHETSGGDSFSAFEAEDSNSLHTRAQEFFKEFMNQLATHKGSISLPADTAPSLPGASINKQDLPDEASTGLGIELHGPRRIHSVDGGRHIRKLSASYGKVVVSASPPLERARTRPSDGSLDTPSFDGSLGETMMRSLSGISGSSTLADGVSMANNDPSDKPLDERLEGRRNKAKGAELLQVIRSGTPEALHILLLSDASLEERDEKGKTPLILAASTGKVDMVEKLLTHEADVQAIDNRQATALHNAVEGCHWTVMSMLLKAGCTDATTVRNKISHMNINSAEKMGRTPLHCCTSIACAEGDMKIAAEELINNKADINAKDNAKLPPIYYAIKHRKYSVVELFLEKGASLDFERPPTSAYIVHLLDDHLAKRMPSPTINNRKTKEDSPKSPQGRKGSWISRRRSSAKDCIG